MARVERYSPAQRPSNDELFAPSALSTPQEQALRAMQVLLRRDTEELAQEGGVPRRVVLHVVGQALISASKEEERSRVQERRDVGE
jgi:hypothetical protein